MVLLRKIFGIYAYGFLLKNACTNVSKRATQGPIFISLLFVLYFLVKLNFDYESVFANLLFKNQLSLKLQENIKILPYDRLLKMRAFRYCSPAVLFTRQTAQEFSKILLEYEGYPKPYDELLWEYDMRNFFSFRKVGMMLQPNLVFHGFADSTKDGDKIWS